MSLIECMARDPCGWEPCQPTGTPSWGGTYEPRSSQLTGGSHVPLHLGDYSCYDLRATGDLMHPWDWEITEPAMSKLLGGGEEG